MEFGAFILMTYGFVVLIQRNALAEWYAGIYIGAFVARAAHSAWLSCKNGNTKEAPSWTGINRRGKARKDGCL